MALAGGIPFPVPVEDKPALTLNKGGSAPTPPPPPKPPVINIPTPPTPPAPPPPPTASSADVAAAQQQGMSNAAKGFGYKASLLKGNDPSVNSATGSGSLLGN